ncbi:cytochrome c4 [Suttonella sp. R2A3]|uniref:c-type cytochrome n=1 Tax=Suttonella sp. R2A3 TaxID=2908648 RepID=UPI001F443229|nr:cytochrome c4 [Suttonella sp. R2A3]UJF24777.1 cytochrome c4 [Suttonella sp. R2A3]
MKKGILAVAVLTLSASVMAAGDAAAGEQKAAVCMACHGPGGVSANPEWPSLAGQGEKYLIKQLHDFKNGDRVNAVMAPQAAMLSDEDMANLAAYYASQEAPKAKTKGAGENPEEMLALGEALYRGGDMEKGIPACSACHGPTGAGISVAAFPQLSAQHAKYTRIQLDAFKAASGSSDQATDAPVPSAVRANDPNAMMRDIASQMTPKQIEAVAYYIQGLN